VISSGSYQIQLNNLTNGSYLSEAGFVSPIIMKPYLFIYYLSIHAIWSHKGKQISGKIF